MNNADLLAAYKRGALIIDQRTTFNVDRNAYLNASEAGTCIRKAWYGKQDPARAFVPNGFAARGKHMEKYIVDALVSANILLDFAGEHQQSFADDGYRISATPDGVFVTDGTLHARGIEFKTIDPRTNVGNLPKKAHITQLQIGMAMLNRKRGMNFVERGGVLMYVDASNYDVVHLFDVEYDDDILDKMKRRARQVLSSKTPDALDREGKRNDECKYCPFVEECSPGELEAPIKRKRAAHNSLLADNVEEMVHLKAAIDTMKKQYDNLKEGIVSELEKRKVRELEVAGQRVTLTTSTRTTFDKKGAMAKYPDLVKYERVGSPFTTLNIKALDK